MRDALGSSGEEGGRPFDIGIFEYTHHSQPFQLSWLPAVNAL